MKLPTPLSPPCLHHLPSVIVFGLTDIGSTRSNNEDNLLLDETMGLAMLADGMGGHAAGEVASAEALVAMRDYLKLHAPGLPGSDPDPTLKPDPDITMPDPMAREKDILQDAMAHANARLYEENCVRSRSDGSGMGTTLTGFWRPTRTSPLLTFHVGDSRLYRLRGAVLDQLTRDQTLYQQALETGMLDKLPARNVLLQAVGPAPSIAAEIRSHPVLAGDVLMLCSDGLHASVAPAEIEQVLGQVRADSLGHDCERLIGMAKANGGRDNITVLLGLCLPH